MRAGQWHGNLPARLVTGGDTRTGDVWFGFVKTSVTMATRTREGPGREVRGRSAAPGQVVCQPTRSTMRSAVPWTWKQMVPLAGMGMVALLAMVVPVRKLRVLALGSPVSQG